MPIRFMNRYLILLLLVVGMQNTAFSQLETTQETFRIKALALEKSEASRILSAHFYDKLKDTFDAMWKEASMYKHF